MSNFLAGCIGVALEFFLIGGAPVVIILEALK